MKKLLKILIVTRHGLSERWWHRLANVLIFGSTILVFLITLALPLDEYRSWSKKYLDVYNFEPEYNSHIGEVVKCNVRGKLTKEDSSIYCNGEEVDKYPIIKKYNKIIRDIMGINGCYGFQPSPDCTRLKLDTIPINPTESEKFESLDREQLIQLAKKTSNFKNLEVKRASKYIHFEIFGYFIFAALLAFGWFVFWQSIIYRALVYVVLGSHFKSALDREK
jgi:hypothetical protein